MDSNLNETNLLNEEVNKDGEQPQNLITDDTEIEINGEKVPLKELKGGYLRQSDYTRKTQALADKERELEAKNRQSGGLDEDTQNAITLLKQQGFITKDELEREKRTMTEDQKLREILENAPELKSFEQAIRHIGQTSNEAYEDIIVKYGFSSKDKLEKARQSRFSPRGELTKGTQEKKISEMSPAEYEKWKEKNGVGKSGMFSSATKQI